MIDIQNDIGSVVSTFMRSSISRCLAVALLGVPSFLPLPGVFGDPFALPLTYFTYLFVVASSFVAQEAARPGLGPPSLFLPSPPLLIAVGHTGCA